MMDLLNNPWIIGIVSGVIVGLILYHIFGIGKTKKETKDTRKAGVIDEGLNSTYINCEGIGQDAGLISKGRGLRSINSKWSSRDEIAEAQKLKFEENRRNQYKNSAK